MVYLLVTIQVGFPEGVINVLSGYGPTAGRAIAYHMDIEKASEVMKIEKLSKDCREFLA